MRIRIYSVCLWVCFLAFAVACRKSAFLDAKPDQTLVVPTSLADLQAILDNDRYMNGSFDNEGLIPSLGEIAADDYYVSNDQYNSLTIPMSKTTYVWASDVYAGTNTVLDWSAPYRSVLYANVVLDGLSNIGVTADNRTDYEREKGSALFYRSHMFYQLAQVFAKSYVKDSAANWPGIPLRLESDVNEKITRASLEQSYRRIITDLQTAVPLLPVQPAFKTRPGQAAAYGLLARVYQTMEVYDSAGLYADSCLRLQHDLIDFNTLDSTASYAFARFNDEVIFHANLIATNVELLNLYVNGIDSFLLNSYAPGDLRRPMYFLDNTGYQGGFSFRGSYNGSQMLFGGIAVDEMYLIRAEASVRQGNVAGALADLNTLLQTRWTTGQFVPFTAASPDEALHVILSERRKELLMRGLRWTDLRRLNRYPEYQKVIWRLVDGTLHALAPGDNRYTYPIPPVVIDDNPGMPQNPR